MQWGAREWAMPWAKRRAPSSLERSTADVVQLSRRCGTDVLRRGSCELTLEIAVGIGYHAEWQTGRISASQRAVGAGCNQAGNKV